MIIQLTAMKYTRLSCHPASPNCDSSSAPTAAPNYPQSHHWWQVIYKLAGLRHHFDEDVTAVDRFVEDHLLVWSGVQQVHQCGASAQPVMCAGVSRIPSLRANHAITFGHWILYDLDKGPLSEETLAHEMIHVLQFEVYGGAFPLYYALDPSRWECQANDAGAPKGACHR